MKWGLNKPKLKCYYTKHIQLNANAILQKKTCFDALCFK